MCDAASKDRSVKLRCQATGWLRLVVREWDDACLGDRARVEDAILCMVKDGSNDVRAGARRVFADYARRYPADASRAQSRLDANTRRLIAQESAAGAYDGDGDDWVPGAETMHARTRPHTSQEGSRAAAGRSNGSGRPAAVRVPGSRLGHSSAPVSPVDGGNDEPDFGARGRSNGTSTLGRSDSLPASSNRRTSGATGSGSGSGSRNGLGSREGARRRRLDPRRQARAREAGGGRRRARHRPRRGPLHRRLRRLQRLQRTKASRFARRDVQPPRAEPRRVRRLPRTPRTPAGAHRARRADARAVAVPRVVGGKDGGVRDVGDGASRRRRQGSRRRVGQLRKDCRRVRRPRGGPASPRGVRRAGGGRRGGPGAGPRAGTPPRAPVPRAVPAAGGRQGERPRARVRRARRRRRRALRRRPPPGAPDVPGAVQGAARQDGGAGVRAVRAERAGRGYRPARRAGSDARERGYRRLGRVGRESRAPHPRPSRASPRGGRGGARRGAHARGPGGSAAVPRVRSGRGRGGGVQSRRSARAVDRSRV